MKHLLPQGKQTQMEDLFWTFGTQSSGFSLEDRKLDRERFLEDRAATAGGFNATMKTNKSKKGKRKNDFFSDSDSDDEYGEEARREAINSIELDLRVVDKEFEKYL